MDLSGPDNCAQDMVQQRDEDPTPPPAVPAQAKRWCRKEPVVSLTHSPLKGLNVVLSRVDTAARSENSLVSSKQDTKMGQDEGTGE